MGVTRIRYLLDQWRLRSVAVTLQNRLGHERPSPGWKIPGLEEPPAKPPSLDAEPPSPPPAPAS